jgi:hypothetical protein
MCQESKRSQSIVTVHVKKRCCLRRSSRITRLHQQKDDTFLYVPGKETQLFVHLTTLLNYPELGYVYC